ncbi:AAA family ATPase [Mycobacterium sp. ITM-2016-00318]|uniref:ATP-binding protein n=1 Tax=Mycobacterium sp. ITM-2016-00318 TaxID=2099693 RepID=UPI000CF982CF|nr:adenylate/guanylate cyclase domain-containing protein [Mycobacterium sp. ITM-2016-00318]WNG92144.1 adenylate/guanylate cyclase domain-containing protein [Mycobacterium sp. ITM-2016-00318]
MATSCGACGAGLRDGARFCDACGTPVAAESRAEYKQVTVLFADVVRSMDIAAAVGAERLREIMGEVFRRSSVIVQRYGGTVDKFTGDGIMAVFGAPIALEDHAVRACRAALDIHADVAPLAEDVESRDKTTLRLRIGLNSGEVITGEIGAGPTTYTAIGEQVGMAQRMESVAPPGGVMVSESTARLVDTVAMLGEIEQVSIKGAANPVPAQRLQGMASGPRPDRLEPTFVGRQWEMSALNGVLERSINGNGSIVGLVGPPGIGKSRIVSEVTARAKAAGAEVFATYCESHTTEVAFQAAASLLRSTIGTDGLADADARQQVRARFADANEEDLLLLNDLLGIGDPEDPLPQIDPDARRRRVAAVVKAAALARRTPVVYVIEDVHWIDGISESMLAEFLTVVPQTPSLALVTYRPEYHGALARAPRSQTIALEPLDDSQMRALGAELLGEDRSVAELTDLVAERAAGNPFFAEEIVRDLSERDVLLGGRGCYLCAEPLGEIHVPRTLQAVIAARIDRLDAAAKRTLNAASVIGSRFTPQMLESLDVDAALDELVAAELVDQAAFDPGPEYSFRHPLVRAVAYESQLKSDRAQLHGRVARAIEHTDQNAALIAEHLYAAGDLAAAYDWHMRAGAWSAKRDIAAAQLSWERAIEVADALPHDVPNRMAVQIAPRTLLCGNMWKRFHPDISPRFEELRDLCTEADDKASLAVGMAGMTIEHVLHGRVRDASALASETMALVESIADPGLTIALSFAAVVAKHETGETAESLRWTQNVIDLTAADFEQGRLIFESPRATALAWRGVARFRAGMPGFREDFDEAMSIAEKSDTFSQAAILTYKYAGIPRGVYLADSKVLGEIESALKRVERSMDDITMIMLRLTFGIALIHSGADPKRGYDEFRALREICIEQCFAMNMLPVFDAYLALERAQQGDTDFAMQQWRNLFEDMERTGQLSNIDIPLIFMAGQLLCRGDYDEADRVIDRLLLIGTKHQWRSREISGLQLRILVAEARGEHDAYRELRDRYRAMSNELGFEGHMKWAAEMR